jgi:hypothetical protein
MRHHAALAPPLLALALRYRWPLPRTSPPARGI